MQRQGRGLGLVLLGAMLGSACADPALDVPRARDRITVTFEPVADPSALPAAFRARLGGMAGEQPWLFRGELSDHHARAVRSGELPTALGERAVPLHFWSDAEDELVQPLAWLAPGERYTLAFAGLGIAQLWDVAAEAAPRSEQVFPAPGRTPQRLAVQCSASFAQRVPELELQPGNVPVSASFEKLGDSNCLTFTVEGESMQPAVLPPELAGTLLAPAAFDPAPGSSAEAPIPCGSGQLVSGACFETLDDRVLVTPKVDTLWRLDAPAPRLVVSSAQQRATLVSGLVPGQQVELHGMALSSNGSRQKVELVVTTAAVRRHLVLSEVLANPLGPEPVSEWIELLNDANQAVSLTRLWLEDTAGRAFLPDVELLPHEIVLLVAAGFRASPLDVPIPKHVRLLELTSLGARGLANSGEALLLVGPEGVVSRFPSVSAKHAGRSVARRRFDATDDDPAAFGEHGGLGASPGVPNAFD